MKVVMSADPYADVTEQQVAEAEMVEQRVRRYRSDADIAFLRMGFFLKLCRDRGYYRARGYSSFRDWVESPEIDLPFRRAHDLVRIVERLEPTLGSNLLVQLGPSKARALLPLANVDEQDAVANRAELLEAAHDMLELTWKDAFSYVRERRGRRARAWPRTRFLASLGGSERSKRLVLHVAEGNSLYVAGELQLEPQHAEAFLEALKLPAPR